MVDSVFQEVKHQEKTRLWVVLAHELSPRHGKSPQKLHLPVQTAQVQVLDRIYKHTSQRGSVWEDYIHGYIQGSGLMCTVIESLGPSPPNHDGLIFSTALSAAPAISGYPTVTLQVPVTHNPSKSPVCCWGNEALGMMGIIECWSSCSQVRLLLTLAWVSQAYTGLSPFLHSQPADKLCQI